MRRWPVFGVALGLLWPLVRGVTLAPLPFLREFVLGLAVGLPLAFVFRRFYRPEIDVRARLRGVGPAVVYLTLFLWEVVTANLDVAMRVLAPSMPIHPAVVVVPLRVESDAAVTTIANSITLTPGTVTMDYDDERNALYVHAIDGRDPAGVVAPIRRWEDYALRIFDEDAAPSDHARSAYLPEATGGDDDGE